MVFKVASRRAVLLAWDALAWLLASSIVILFRYDLDLSQNRWHAVWLYTWASMLCQAVIGILVHLYLGRSRVGSFDEATSLALLVGVQSFVLWVVFRFYAPGYPNGAAVFIPVVAFLLMMAGRWAVRTLRSGNHRRREGGVPALVYGAGNLGHQLANLIDGEGEPPFRILGYIDDDPSKRHLRIRGYRVVGPGDDVVALVSRCKAEIVIVAMSDISPSHIKELAESCKQVGVKVVVVPPLRELVNGQISLGQFREFNVSDLLGRRPIRTDIDEISGYVRGRVVLITGAGGSIGSELARQVKTLRPSKLLLLDRDESALHAVQLSLYGHALLDTDDIVLCSIRDAEALERIFEEHRPQVVLHAAALKHLPMLERFPEEGWKTNVLGTLNVLRVAERFGVQHFVNISTDKAADATCVLGQTKRVAERLTAHFAQRTGKAYVSVRFGNVLGSRGSVLHTFRAQIERGGPVTVTHPDVTRFFMTIPEACELVLQAGAIGRPGSVLVLDMGESVSILDVARRLIEQSGRQIEIEFTGLRPGEKLHEVLFADEEQGEPTTHPLITQVRVPALALHNFAEVAERWSGRDLSPFDERITA